MHCIFQVLKISINKPVRIACHFRRVQAQGIQVCKLIYLSEKEFEFVKLKRLEFLKRVGYAKHPSDFEEKLPKGRKAEKEDALGSPTNEDLKRGIHRYTPCYEATNISSTRDSLFWSWRRVAEYYQDFLDEEQSETKKIIRIDPRIRKR
jgi:hypothetical protein